MLLIGASLAAPGDLRRRLLGWTEELPVPPFASEIIDAILKGNPRKASDWLAGKGVQVIPGEKCIEATCREMRVRLKTKRFRQILAFSAKVEDTGELLRRLKEAADILSQENSDEHAGLDS